MKQVTIAQNDANQRVDKFLTKTYPNLPQSMLYKAIRKKDIKVNGKRCEISTRLQEGDVLTMYLKDEFFAQAPKEYDFLKAPNDTTLYELMDKCLDGFFKACRDDLEYQFSEEAFAESCEANDYEFLSDGTMFN